MAVVWPDPVPSPRTNPLPIELATHEFLSRNHTWPVRRPSEQESPSTTTTHVELGPIRSHTGEKEYEQLVHELQFGDPGPPSATWYPTGARAVTIHPKDFHQSAKEIKEAGQPGLLVLDVHDIHWIEDLQENFNVEPGFFLRHWLRPIDSLRVSTKKSKLPEWHVGIQKVGSGATETERQDYGLRGLDRLRISCYHAEPFCETNIVPKEQPLT
jgi:hypothetical protein